VPPLPFSNPCSRLIQVSQWHELEMLVEVGVSAFGGKGLMSRRDFQAGDVVLVESPFLSVVLPGPQCHADARACPGNRVFLELSAYRSGDRPCWMNI